MNETTPVLTHMVRVKGIWRDLYTQGDKLLWNGKPVFTLRDGKWELLPDSGFEGFFTLQRIVRR